MKTKRKNKQADFKCIYCGAQSNPSKEHYLPRSLGAFKGYEPLLGKICVGCNSDFKILEDQFIHSSPEAFFREMLGIKGRKHHSKKAIFYERSAGTDPLVIIGKYPGEDYEIFWEVNSGTFTIRELCQVLIKDENGKIHPVPIPKTMDTPDDLKRAIKQRGLKKHRLFKVLCDKHELKHIEHLLSELLPPNKKIALIEPKTSGSSIQTKVNSIVTDKYFRAIAKIGFHYFLNQFPNFTGAETEFDPIRSFIKDGKGDDKNFVKMDSRQIVKEFSYGCRPKNYLHILALDKNHIIIARMQFFVGIKNLPIVWKVNLGINPSKIIFREGVAHSFMYYDVKTNGHDGEMSELFTSRYVKSLW